MEDYEKSALQEENMRLKNRLFNLNKDYKKLKGEHANLLEKYKQVTQNRKQRYRNNGKGGKGRR